MELGSGLLIMGQLFNTVAAGVPAAGYSLWHQGATWQYGNVSQCADVAAAAQAGEAHPAASQQYWSPCPRHSPDVHLSF